MTSADTGQPGDERITAAVNRMREALGEDEAAGAAARRAASDDPAAEVSLRDLARLSGTAHSVQRTLYLVIALLALPMIAMAWLNLREATVARGTAIEIAQTNAAFDTLTQAASAFARERDLTEVALARPRAMPAGLREAIGDARSEGAAALQSARRAVVVLGIGGEVPALLGQLEVALDDLRRLRGPADDMTARGGGAAPDLAGGWVEAANRMIDAIGAVKGAVAAGGESDPRAADLFALKQAVFELENLAGRERGRLGARIASGAPLDAADNRYLGELRGRITAARDTMNRIARTHGTQAVSRAIAAADTRYFERFDALRQQVYEAARAAAAGEVAAPSYPVGIDTWFAESAAAIAALQEVQTAVTAQTLAYAQSVADRATWSLVRDSSIVLIGVVAAILSIWFVSRRVIGPLAQITRAMGRLAGGDLDRPIPGLDRSDEIGAMARAVAVFRDNAREVQRLAAEREDIKRRAEAARKAELGALADQMEQTVSGVVDTVATAAMQFQALAESLAHNVDRTNGRATNVATASEQASANVQTVAAAAEQLASSLGEISRQVTQSNSVATRATAQATDTNTTVLGLNEAAEKIGEVVDLITEIASRTNLLALNATIEAARAGEAGRGFAVVAAEVKTLANQTAKATEEIGAQIAAIQSATGGAVDAITHIARTIAEVNEIATSISAAVEEQGIATQEIARNVHEAARGTEEVSVNITGVTEAARETSDAAAQLLQAAGELGRSSEALRTEVSGFIARVRAA
ncbi:MAG: methyl-accepting chemotaxis protein [Alphaproteobacteria bacterium]|nr:methyl-accepting chemotaxis protein [Alphaproteobacteria bacterium]MDX5369320.1 methyl-accepting chemotaxis protein [Alphaproteobacteria bacterium]MDX5464005.1 methyl-accepting chemotaxis protein [Alphaproteobacteria bacterium]